MILLALGISLQLPFRSDLLIYVGLIEFILGVYQLGMSFLLRPRLSSGTRLLELHFFISIFYIAALILIGILGPKWMDDLWTFALFIFPWVLAVFFLVVVDDLEYKRGYRV